jgi:DNA repair protein RadD
VEVVSDGRSTRSFPRFAQAFGRALRPFEGKSHGLYIDHVSNVKVHGLPDKPRVWTLDDERGKRKSSEGEQVRVCTNCFTAYEPFLTKCPYCGFKPVPAARSSPEFVDGDLYELDPLVLAQMRGEIERIDSSGPSIPKNLIGTPAELRLRRLWGERQAAQETLRKVMSVWAGMQQTLYGLSDSELYRRFYLQFNIDVLSAQQLDRIGSEALIAAIREQWT